METQRIPDETPTPDDYKGDIFTAPELREVKRIGALLLSARKPNVRTPPRGWTCTEEPQRRACV